LLDKPVADNEIRDQGPQLAHSALQLSWSQDQAQAEAAASSHPGVQQEGVSILPRSEQGERRQVRPSRRRDSRHPHRALQPTPLPLVVVEGAGPYRLQRPAGVPTRSPVARKLKEPVTAQDVELQRKHQKVDLWV
jgi:hypothetical protein